MPSEPRYKAFENYVISFLERTGFQDVDGGDKFTLGGEQIDACGGHEDTLVIIECKYATRKREINIRQQIAELRGKIPNIRRGARAHRIYGKYRKHVFVLATKNYEIKKVNREYSRKRPQIFIWDDRLIDEYLDLSRSIGVYAKYNLLGEMDVSPLANDPIRVPALRMKYRQRYLYSFFMHPKELLAISYVARREKGNEKYYQRIVKHERLASIAKYINDEEGMFPNSIVLSINDKPIFRPNRELDRENYASALQYGILQFPKKYRSCWIIDGQHRLYAFTKAHRFPLLPVTAFDRLRIEKQSKLFIDINEKQKPVDSNLIWDLHGQMRPGSEEGIISNAAKYMNSVGPFSNRINIPLEGRNKKGGLNLTGICTSIKRVKLAQKHTKNLSRVTNPLYKRQHYQRARYLGRKLSEYFSVADAEIQASIKEDLVFTNGGVSIMIYLYEAIIYSQKTAPSASKLKEYLECLNNYLVRNRKQLQSMKEKLNSEGGRTAVLNEWMLSISNSLDDKRMKHLLENADSYEEDLARFERELGGYICRMLSQETTNWIKQRVNSEIVARAQDRLKKKIPEDPRSEVHEFFTLGEMHDILKRADNWPLFERRFINIKGGFVSKDEFDGALDRIKKYRNPPMHGAKLRLDDRTVQWIEMNVQTFRECMGLNQPLV